MKDAYDLDFFPYLGHLPAQGKTLYRELLPAIKKGMREYEPVCSVNAETVFSVVRAIYMDHPEIYWMTGASHVTGVNGVVKKIKVDFNDLAANISKNNELLRNAIKTKWLAGTVGKSFAEAERIIHDRMVREISYLHTVHDQTAFAALVEKKAVCAGYTRGFQLIMQIMGYPCFYCSGMAKGRKDTSFGNHAWNILKIQNDYYAMDLTWDDCYDSTDSNKIAYTYYNCTDAQLAATHRRDENCLFLPKCAGTKYRFEAVNGASPELELVYQDGVTNRTPILKKDDYIKFIRPYARAQKTGTYRVSFPTNSKEVVEKCLDIFEQLMKEPGAHKGGWNIKSSSRDYHNKWYRLELTITLK